MAPNTISNLDSLKAKVGQESKQNSVGQGPAGQPASTYPGIWKYPTNRDESFRPAENWLESKARDDDIGPLWRVFDGLYDLTGFIHSHPGGSDWIQLSRGTDITEAFVASHVINRKYVGKMLENYYVKPITSPRITPYTLKPDGFYMTLKNRAEPIFKKVGTGPSFQMLLRQDGITITFLLLALLASTYNSTILAIISGTALALQTIGSHNFLHLKENWRKYYMDMSLMSSFEFRITHTFSHHMFPNTYMDYDLYVYPTFEFCPNRPKHWMQRKFSMIYSHLLYAVLLWMDITKRFALVAKGMQRMRPENLLPFLELLVLIGVAEELLTGLYIWFVMHTCSSYMLSFIAIIGSHHHSTCFIDGDEPVPDPDFGIGQLDATMDRAEDFFNDSLFLTLVTFGEHPLHHMFPTVCHSKLHHARKVFEETCREFKINFPGIPQVDMYFSLYETLARTEPHSWELRKAK